MFYHLSHQSQPQPFHADAFLLAETVSFRVVDFSTTDRQVRKIGFMNTLGTKSTYSYVDVDNASASPKNQNSATPICCRCTKLVRNLSGNSRLNLSSSVPSYIR